MNLSKRAAWVAAVPLLLVVAGAVLLPFAWRSVGFVADCVRGDECALRDLFADGYYLKAIVNTVWLSALSTFVALAIGCMAAVALAEKPSWRRASSVLANLGANFAGVPLALALTLLFGAQGVLRQALANVGVALPFALEGNGGLLLAYLCFQVPLATLMLALPVQMLEAGLMDAAATLGASPALFWRRVGLPLLLPSLLEVGSLLFANAAAAYATPFALSGTSANVLAVRIAALVSGDIFSNPDLSSLLALLMFVLLVAAIAGANLVARRLRGRDA
jgi:putative spermidine/putrescine transport system permease protein